MARLQILELPEGSGDDRPPFVLVVDQMPKEDAAFEALRCDLGFATAEQLGARAVLVFEETIDIPANDVPVDADGNPLFLKLHVEGDFEQFRQQAQEEIRKAQAELREAIGTTGSEGPNGPKCQYCGADCSNGRSWDGGDLYACGSCADWRAKLNQHKTALLEALGMDRTRDWDDIRNAAAGLRKERDAKAAALERVRALDDDPEMMDAQHPDSSGYLHGYRVAISTARRATWDQLAENAESGTKE
jgi:hypothetical protein